MEGPLTEVAFGLDFAAPFGAADLERIASWVPNNRLLLLCLAGLWRKVPADLWARWVQEAGQAMPFPPDELIPLEDRLERMHFLADCLDCTPNSLARRWSLYHGLVEELDFIRELRGP